VILVNLKVQIQGNEFHLSGFTGPSPVAIKGKINDDLTTISDGEISFGIYVTQKFEATKDKNASLPDPYKLTFLKEGYKN